ncbi:MAG: exodeoxyribonuclease V subunit gamma [Victivallaceae bacterium]
MGAVGEFDKGNKFHLVSGNRMEMLAEDLAGRLKKSCGKATLAPETVVVQSRGMERWLQLKLAEQNGIAGNIDFPFPRTFVSKYVFQPLLKQRGGIEDDFSPAVYAWKIFDKLPELTEKYDVFSTLKHYIEHDDTSLKAYQLAEKIAGLFEQYQIFRPDVAAQWDRGQNPLGAIDQSGWQWKLWQELRQRAGGNTFASLYRELLQCVYPEIYPGQNTQTPDFEPLKQLKRVFFFGFSSIPPAFLDILLAVSKYIEVYFYYLNPCAGEWQYDLSEKKRLQLFLGDARSLVEKADYKESFAGIKPDDQLEELCSGSGNSLLSSLGTQGREFFGLLNTTDETPDAIFEPVDNAGTLLQKLQRDVQENTEPSQDGARETVLPTDRSIQIHSCHSPMREVETLFENLTAMFDRDHTLLPKDILVLCPAIDIYAPFIEAVFKSRSADDPRWCFVTVADRSSLSSSQEAETFIAILELCNGRFTAPEVLEILETPAVAAAFNLDEDNLAIMRQWINSANISWGIDGEFRQETTGIAFDDQSWRAGIDRMLAGFAFGGETDDSGRLFESDSEHAVLPLFCCEGNQTEILGSLNVFIEKLFLLRKMLYGKAEIDLSGELPERLASAWWEVVLHRIIHDFFSEATEFSSGSGLLREAITGVLNNIKQSDFSGEITPEIMLSVLRKHFEVTPAGGGFLRGGITFCEARPMRSIPARIVCMLGMDEKSFPRPQNHISFDLMSLRPRFGDRSARNDDRFLFLETLLSARDCFYLSYVGQGVKDNESLPPSIMLSELLDYIGGNYVYPNSDKISQRLTTRHPLQAFSWKYFIPAAEKAKIKAETGVVIPDNLISYSAENCRAAATLFEPRRVPTFISDELFEIPEELLTISLDDLCRFFINPSKYFLEKRLNIFPAIQDIPELPTREMFELDGLAKYQLAETILRENLADWNQLDKKELQSVLLKRFHAAGALPVGEWGNNLFNELLGDFFPFSDVVASFGGKKLEPAVAEETFDNGVSLSVRFDDLFSSGGDARQLLFKFAKFKEKDLIKGMIYHLAAGLEKIRPQAANGIQTFSLGKDSYAEYSPRGPEQATESLRQLTDIYLEGLKNPLPFFPATSKAFFCDYIENGAIAAASDKAKTAWEKSYNELGENSDPYFNFCFGAELKTDEKFQRIANQLGELLSLNQKTTNIDKLGEKQGAGKNA